MYNVGKKIVILMIFLQYYNMSFAQSQPVVTRWIHPQNLPKPTHTPLKIMTPPKFERVDLPLPPNNIISPPANQGRICIVVEWAILYGIQAALTQYQQDLAQLGYTSVVYTSVGSAENLRSHLAQLYAESQSLVGAILIGNLPYITFEIMDDFGSGSREYDDFPCDIFYMDLNGTWTDTLNDGQVQSNNGKYDTHSGNVGLEIWVARIKTDTLTALGGTGATLINTYFNKNHRFRIGTLAPAKNGLVYNDDDWQSAGNADGINLQRIYDTGNVTRIFDSEITTATDYKQNRLTQLFEMMAIRSHGWTGGHGFYQNEKTVFDYIYPNDYTRLDPQALFYSLFVCSGSDYTAEDYLAGTVAFNPDNSGLVVWGSTKTGGMFIDDKFYETLALPKSIGEAFKIWFNTVQSIYSNNQSFVVSWWYGMVIIGDGSLKLCQTGDLDCNGSFNIFDLQRLINCIFSKGSCANGDLNGDGQYNIFDVQQLVNKIFKPSSEN